MSMNREWSATYLPGQILFMYIALEEFMYERA